MYELTTISCPLLALEEAAARAREWIVGAASGTAVGIWRSDIGPLGQLMVLRAFDTDDALHRERERALMSDDPFGARGVATALSMESYARFPFLPPIGARDYGGVFEFRTYFLKPGGLPATLAGWQAAIGPAHVYTDHLVVNMYALDGPPRITHIWGFPGVDERIRVRADHYAAKLWPPKGGPENIDHAVSTIAFSFPGFPVV